MSTVHIPVEPQLGLRQLLLPAVLLLVLGVYFGRLWFLQVVEADELRVRAERGTVASVERLAPRGTMVDRKGRVVASAQGQVVVTARPLTVLKDDVALGKVAARLGITPARLKARVSENARAGELPAAVFVGADLETASWIAENAWHLPGWGVETQPMRVYTAGRELAHILGFVRQPREEDVARLESQGIEPAAFVGIAGLERQYEGLLMGQAGAERMAVDARRRPVRALGTEVPEPGKDLVLGIDLDLQRYALALLAGRVGSVVAIEPATGEVLALVSSPTFDANQFLGGISSEEYAALRDDPARPLFFRAVAAAYSPGSTFKLVTAMAAERAGLFDPERTTVCRGEYRVGNRRFKCLGNHGAIRFHRAMEKSCNVYFADLAVRVGPDRVVATALEMGLGKRTGIDLPTESKGVVPTDEWWARNRDRRFMTGDTVNLGVGQGELATTPIQMAMVAALAANRGHALRPHLLKAWRRPGDAPTLVDPVTAERLDASALFWEALDRSLVAVVESGTLAGARVPGLAWAGKTGSAENRRDGKTHSWVIGYAPATNPKVAFCVMVEEAGHGSEVAGPIVRAFLQHMFFPPQPVRPPQPSAKIEATRAASAASAESPAASASEPQASAAD